MSEKARQMVLDAMAEVYQLVAAYGLKSAKVVAKLNEVTDSVYDLGASDGKAAMQTAVSALEAEVAQLTAEKEKSFDEGYQQGHGDALKSLDIAEESAEVAEEKAEEEVAKEVVKTPLVVTADESEFTATSINNYNSGDTEGLKGVVIC